MLARHKGEIPFFLLLIFFISGIWFGISVIPGTLLPAVYGLLLVISIFFGVLNLSYNILHVYKARWLGGIIVIIVIFLFGCVMTLEHDERSADTHFCKIPSKSLIVQINNEPVVRNKLTRFTASVKESINNGKETPVSGTLLITISDATTGLKYGDQLLIPRKFNSIDPPFVPAQFNYKRYLGYQNVFYQAYLYPSQYLILSSDNGNPLIAHSLLLRQRLVEKLKVNIRDTDAIAVASTLILGYKADLSNDVLQAYSKTGTVHVLSVSGAHVAIVYILLTFVLSFLNNHQTGRIVKAFIIIALIWYYSMLTGFSPAVCRAALMISFFIAGKTFNRYINTLNLMAASAFLLLVYNPYFIADAGFQLSYLAVFGLIVFQPVVYKWFKFKNKWADKLWALCSVSLAAQVITFPLSAFYFHQFPVYFLISNLFIIVPSAVIMYSGLAYLMLPQIAYLSKLLALILENTIILMNRALLFTEHLPFAVIGRLWIYTYQYILLYVLIFCLFYFLYNKNAWLLRTAALCCLLLSISISLNYYQALTADNIAWLNLGKHQGIVFKEGCRAVVLTDLCGEDKAYQFGVQPYLDSCKVTDVTIAGFKTNLKSDWLYKSGNFLLFRGKTVLFLSNNRELRLRPRLNADFIYLIGKSGINLAALNENFNYNMLISNSSISNRVDAGLKKQAAIYAIKYVSLKRNISLITVSN